MRLFDFVRIGSSMLFKGIFNIPQLSSSEKQFVIKDKLISRSHFIVIMSYGVNNIQI